VNGNGADLEAWAAERELAPVAGNDDGVVAGLRASIRPEALKLTLKPAHAKPAHAAPSHLARGLSVLRVRHPLHPAPLKAILRINL
jgi:hypothetical protein